MKKILIGTHNKGKFKEIAFLISKKYKKNSPFLHKIPSPKETSKTFSGNSKLKANFYSKFVNYPVISDDSGLCIKSLKNKIKGKIGTFSFKDKKVIQELDIYRVEKNRFIKF